MKIRNSFVSNSSSSSFVVEIKDCTEEEIICLLEEGFKYSGYISPSALGWAKWTSEEVIDNEKIRSLVMVVSCNEDEVIEFLTKNNIPFTGSTHYGHYNVFFDRNTKFVMMVHNLGLEMETYGHNDEFNKLWRNMRLEQNNWEEEVIHFISIEKFDIEKEDNDY